MADDETATTTVDLSLLDRWIDKDDDNDPFSIVQKTQLMQLTCRDAFAARLHTFRPLTYFCKPTCLSPIVCARFGWINTSLDMLKCVSCKAALVVTIHSKIQKRATLQKLIRAYQSKLATAHQEACPFRFEAELLLLPLPQNNNNKEEEEVDDDNNSEEEEQQQQSKLVRQENVVPLHLASILPRDVWDMIEQPLPLRLVQTRFDKLVAYIVNHDGGTDAEEGAPPERQFPPLSLSDDVLAFESEQNSNNDGDTETSTTEVESPRRQSLSRKGRMLAKLAFDPHRPFTAVGWEKETLLTRLDEILRPQTVEDEIRAQTRAQGAWEDTYEGIAALALFGWVPKEEDSTGCVSLSSTSRTKEEDSLVSLQCPVCLASLKFNMQKYDQHHRHSTPTRMTNPLEHTGGGDAPPAKRRRTHSQDGGAETLNPLTSHRYHCPYVCGFPRDGERKGSPIWQAIASKLLLNYKRATPESSSENGEKEDDGDAATDRLLRLLQSGVSSRGRRINAEDDFAF